MRGIGSQNIDTENHTREPDCCEHLSSVSITWCCSAMLTHLRGSVGLDVLADGGCDETDDREEDEEEETVRSVKQVEHFGDRHV